MIKSYTTHTKTCMYDQFYIFQSPSQFLGNETQQQSLKKQKKHCLLQLVQNQTFFLLFSKKYKKYPDEKTVTLSEESGKG